MPQYGAPAVLEPPRKDLKAPLALIILGIVVIVIGIIVYAWAMSSAVHDVVNADPTDPFGSLEPLAHDVGLLWGSYALMGVGVLVLLVGFIFLILKMV